MVNPNVDLLHSGATLFTLLTCHLAGGVGTTAEADVSTGRANKFILNSLS